MLGDDRFRKVVARVVVDDRNVEGTYASDSVAAVAQSAIAALVLFLVLIMVVYSFGCWPVWQAICNGSLLSFTSLQLGASPATKIKMHDVTVDDKTLVFRSSRTSRVEYMYSYSRSVQETKIRFRASRLKRSPNYRYNTTAQDTLNSIMVITYDMF